MSMKNILIIGAGGVGRVVVHKCAQNPDVFETITLASRTKSKCDQIASELSRPIQTAAVDADSVYETVDGGLFGGWSSLFGHRQL
jgi:saccharopine dehydrogenase (NAD+, L-lysine-forming)